MEALPRDGRTSLLLDRSEALYERGLDELAALPEVSALAGRRICIVGCTGLIGSVLVETLIRGNCMALRRPIEIYGVARRPGPRLVDAPGFHFVQGSIAESGLFERLPGCDNTVYIAGAASDYLARVHQIIETQVVGLERMLEAISSGSRLVYISSTRVYGRETGPEPVTEDYEARVPTMHLDNIYDSHKRFGEALCLWATQRLGKEALVARISNVYGPHENLRSETVISDFARQAAERRRIVLRGHPDSVRNYCSVLDIVQGLLKCLARGRAGCAYNIASDEHMTTRELASQVAAMFPGTVAVEWPTRGVDVSAQRISIARAAAELGFRPRYRFHQLGPLAIPRLGDDLPGRQYAGGPSPDHPAA